MMDQQLSEVLNEIEKREMPLLSWGVTNGTLSERELIDLLQKLEPQVDPEDLLDGLLDHGMVFARGISGDRFRSRMAETVRLAVDLRQWFHGKDWRTAPPLVSDARFLSRARIVPRRDISPDAFCALLTASSLEVWSTSYEATLRSLLSGRHVSAFQARSTSRLLSKTRQRTERGTCITAGTGAGKTLAFYLPAFTHILASPLSPGVPRIVAIYPRVELLRDQLRSLLQTIRDLDAVGTPKLRVGVLYGASPTNRRNATSVPQRGWMRRSDGLECPIIRCLDDDCGGSYRWPDSAGENELLVCATCGAELKTLSFTRDRLQASPPEILFTTTEMVNRLLGSGRMRKLFVGDGSRSPDFILLDEVHTYAGTHGAQVAGLLRRWRAEMSNPSHIVGLSATLADPIGFFSQLVGLNPSNISVEVPRVDEMTEIGREYFMAIRGDPASQTSLLSTTIQASMLLRRMLDVEPGQPSEGAFGTRLFVFTDKLDVVNRLHSQLQDAEGWLPGGVNRKPAGSLALLRGAGSDSQARSDAGQLWDASETLGTLHRSVRVGRTTSRDSGVDVNADVVVATASLEVGFDDPQVGAVLQHKAPRDAAQFLQRRGRAGRDPSMRPWTVVVLSDYGRDRLAFQAYETLFDPVVQPAHLPLKNRVILKMQATWWFLDYLGRFTSGIPVRDVMTNRWGTNRDRQRELASRTLAGIRGLTTESGIDRLSALLRRSLDLEDEDVRSILWDHPRALMTAVLPTIARRLEAVTATGALPSTFRWGEVLADFVPGSLFAPLQTPEIQLVVPSGRPTGDPSVETEAISTAMGEFAPGRVSYRFALGGKRERMWVAPPASTTEELPLEAFCPDYFDLEVPPGEMIMRLVQPRAMQLSRPGPNVSDSAYGTWRWATAFRYEGTPLELDCPAGTSWATHIIAINAMTHRHRCPLTVWRYADQFDVERRAPSEPALTRHRLTLEGAPVAAGFSMDVDGLIIDIGLPSEPSDLNETSGLIEALRVSYFEHLIQTTPLLTNKVPSEFLRGWISEIFLSVLVTEGGDRPLGKRLADISDDRLRSLMADAARDVFGAVGAYADPNASRPPDPGLVIDIDLALGDTEVLDELRALARVLDEEPSTEWLPWLHERLITTLAAALIEAIQVSCPDVDTDDLRPDFEFLQNQGGAPIGRIWISEDQPGGAGAIEAVIDRYVDDPRTFWALVSSALGPCDGERVDANLRAFLRAQEDGQLTLPVERVRLASDLQTLTSAWADLREAMFRLGLDADQTIVTAIATRLLRPGTDRGVETLVGRLLERWDAIESSDGIEVDLRVFAHLAAGDEGLRRELTSAAGAAINQHDWLVGQVVGLLWTRGGRLRSAGLQNYNPYRRLLPTERLLLAHITEAPQEIVNGSDSEWRRHVDEALRKEGRVSIRCSTETSVSSAIQKLLTEPTAVEVLEFHPRVVGLKRSSDGFDLSIELREAQQ